MAIHGTIQQTHLDAIKSNFPVRNRLGFNSSSTLAQARTTFGNLDNLNLNGLSLTSNDLSSMFSWVTAVDGTFNLNGNNLTNVDGLSSLTSVDGNFNLNTNNLTSVAGLSSLTSVGWTLSLSNNNLPDVNGLYSLTSVGGSLFLNTNNLTSVAGLSSLTSVGNSLTLYYNDLTNLNGLSSLASVGLLNLKYNALTDVTGIAWETLTTPYLDFAEALADDVDLVSVLAPMLRDNVSHAILSGALSAYPGYIFLIKPDDYIQENEPTDAKEGNLWFNPSTCKLKIFTEDS